MSKDYRCKDCQWWKEYGGICTYGLENIPFGGKVKCYDGEHKKCKHFKLKK